MAVWVVRAGEKGEQEEFALSNGYAVIGWRKLQRAIPANENELQEAIERAYPNESGGWPSDFRQTWAFANEIKKGDWVVLPLKIRDGRLVDRPKEDGEIAIGKVSGLYEYEPDGEERTRHRIKVDWVSRRVQRVNLDEDIADRITYRQTVFRVECDNAEERIRALAEGR